MTTDDLKAARERVRRLLHGEPFDAIYDADDFETMRYHLPYSEDLFRLADAYVALHDETPIDEEFAASIRNEYMFFRQRSDGYWNLSLYKAGCGAEHSIHALVKTRGQLRLLLLAMGVGE